jgi:hypothetical protein
MNSITAGEVKADMSSEVAPDGPVVEGDAASDDRAM